MRMIKQHDTDVEVWRARTAAWELLALSFRYPDAVLLDAVVSGEWAEAAREIASVLGMSLSEGFDTALTYADGRVEVVSGRGPQVGTLSDGLNASEELHVLRTEATRLFVGSPEPVVSPYEGVHRAAVDGVQALLFINPHSMEVERFMKTCGLGRPEGTNEPLDHVASECELLMHLGMQAAGAPTPTGAPEQEAMPGGSASAAYELFLNEHAHVWMPGFAEQVCTCSRHPFFCAAAELLDAVTGA